MRRAAGLVVGLCLVATVAGVAPAAEPQGGRIIAPGLRAPAAESDVPGGRRPATMGGRGEVGTIERAGKLLSHLGGSRSQVFHYLGAPYVKVHVARAILLPGDYLTVADPVGIEVYRYDREQLAAGRWAMSVTGDTAVVTLHPGLVDPFGMRSVVAGLGVTIDKVARGYTPAEVQARGDTVRGTPRSGRTPPAGHVDESVCGRDDKSDAVCYRETDPVLYRRSKAVARLLINGIELCTGWRFGPDNRMLTNNHCIAEDRDAEDTEVWFNYQCATCDGYAVFRSTKVWASDVLMTDEVLDFTLFTVDSFERIKKFGYLEAELGRVSKGQKVYIPQYPRGEPGMIATASDEDTSGNCAIDDPADTGYDEATDVSYYCDTEGGSSGSPVLSRTSNKVIALHHFGGCLNYGVRIDLIQRRISSPH